MSEAPIVVAVPKGRILAELQPLMDKLDVKPEPSFYDENSRALQFSTNHEHISLIRVRSFDVATFVAFGAAQIGIAGSDVLAEFDYEGLYAPVDLGIGTCRLSLAASMDYAQTDISRLSHLRVATKYPGITQRYFASKGIQAECIKLNGAMELAPKLGLCHHIVDLVSSGATLKANGLVEVETLMEVSSRLIVNRAAFKTRSEQLGGLIARVQEAAHAH